MLAAQGLTGEIVYGPSVTLIPPGANTYTGDTTITHAGTKDPGLFLHNPLALQNSTLNYNVTGSDTALLWFEAGQTDYTEGYTLGGLKGRQKPQPFAAG